MSVNELSELERQRRQSLQKLRELGIEPYPADLYPESDKADDIKTNYQEGKTVCLAGRMMSNRDMGKASFAELQDSTGRIQLYINRFRCLKQTKKGIFMMDLPILKCVTVSVMLIWR